MRKIIVIICAFLPFLAVAQNRYIKNSGSDSATGLSDATAWRTTAKLNTSFSSLNAGDTVFYRAGQTFYGQLVIGKSGTSGNPIVISRYGAGANPVISGFTTVTPNINAGGGVYRVNVPTAPVGLNVVTINGVLQRMGRTPNYNPIDGGYLVYNALNSTIPSITGTYNATNFTGAEVVIRKNSYIIDRGLVTSMVNGTVTYTNPVGTDNTYPGKVKYGYFFQNDIRTLDQFGEWYLNPTTKDLSIYFNTNPAAFTVKVSTIDTLVHLGGRNRTIRTNITLNGLSFEGGNKFSTFAWDGTNISIENCTYDNNNNGSYMWNVTNSYVHNNTVRHSLNNGITQRGRVSAPTTITGNTVSWAGLYAGMGESGDGKYIGIHQDGNNTVIDLNRVDSIGYNGIHCQGNNLLVEKNWVTNFTMVKNDGGGIYSVVGTPVTTYTNRTIRLNTVINAIDATAGTAGSPNAHGIYLDDNSMNFDVEDNTVANIAVNGIFTNSGTNHSFERNTVFNAYHGFAIHRLPPNGNLSRDITFASNIIFPRTTNYEYWNGQLNTPTPVTIQSDMRAVFATLDNNYYRVDLDSPFHYFYHLTYNGTYFDLPPLNLSQWKTYIAKDASSLSIQAEGGKSLIINPYPTDSVFKFLGYKKKLVDGTMYNDSISIAAWGSKLLIDDGISPGINQPPTADAGSGYILTLPTNSVNLDGSASSDPDGPIAAYYWQVLSGAGTFANPNTAVSTLSNLVEGTTIVSLTVTDNNGAQDADTVQVVTLAAPPAATVSIGADQTITLPINFTNLSAVGSNFSGSVSYQWFKVSGTGGTITTPNSQNTTITGLTEGTYRYRVTATSGSQVARDTVSIFVLPAIFVNTPPVAVPGANQIVSLPTSSTSLNGVGVDLDGTITAYLWEKVSGPAGGAISSPTTGTTNVTGLQEGEYVYRLTVTDNGSPQLQGSNTVTIYVVNTIQVKMKIKTN